jgi:hypothetical protein
MTSTLRPVFLSVAAVALVAGLGGCAGGGGTPERVAARVGGTPIAPATVTHWMSVMAIEHLVPDPPSFSGCIAHEEQLALQSSKEALKEECLHEYDELRQRALALLISAQWLIGEAAEEGLSSTGREVARRQREGAVPPVLRNGGATAADARLAAQAELASTKIRQRLTSGEPRVSRAQIANYYRRHIALYEHPELRDIYIVEHIPSAAQASRLRGEVAAGRRQLANVSLHEGVREQHPGETVPGRRALARAIFAARPHVLSSVLLFDRLPAFFEVTHITPAHVQPLAQVQHSIETLLAGEQQRATLARFVAAWRARWTSRTDCSPGYVVQKCRQYKGPMAPEAPPALS